MSNPTLEKRVEDLEKQVGLLTDALAELLAEQKRPPNFEEQHLAFAARLRR